MSDDASKSAAKGWFITMVATVVVQILVALGAALVAGPGIYPDYQFEIVQDGVFILAVVPGLDVLRQLSSARVHRDRRWKDSTAPLRLKSVLVALGLMAATAVSGLFVPWLVIPVFLALLLVVLIRANT